MGVAVKESTDQDAQKLIERLTSKFKDTHELLTKAQKKIGQVGLVHGSTNGTHASVFNDSGNDGILSTGGSVMARFGADPMLGIQSYGAEPMPLKAPVHNRTI